MQTEIKTKTEKIDQLTKDLQSANDQVASANDKTSQLKTDLKQMR